MTGPNQRTHLFSTFFSTHTLRILRHHLSLYSFSSSSSSSAPFHFRSNSAMATNAFTGTSISMCSLLSQLNHRLAFSSVSGPRSALTSSFGRRNVSFGLQPHSIRLKVSCAAKQETVDKVCKIVKKQLALPEGSAVNGESKFSALGADSLDTVEIVMGLEEEFGISVEEDSAQSITTVQEAADLIEEIIQQK